jgi:hypothetical protein
MNDAGSGIGLQIVGFIQIVVYWFQPIHHHQMTALVKSYKDLQSF